MKAAFIKTNLILILAFAATSCFANFYKLDFVIRNLPDRQIVLGIVKGDEFIPVDSLMAKNELAQFRIPEESISGVYRLNLGKTVYARVMDEDPQIFEFIFNKEDIIIETDFKSPEESASVVLSNENNLWFSFKKRIKTIDADIAYLEKKLNAHKGEYDNDAIQTAQQYNLLQKERDMFLNQVLREDSSLLVSQMIRSYKTPLLDGYLTEKERKEVFHKEYFKVAEFENETLIYSHCYTDNIFNYLVSYNDKSFNDEQRETAYKNAVNVILSNTNKNKVVYAFIVDYLKHGFEVLKMGSLVDYISSRE